MKCRHGYDGAQYATVTYTEGGRHESTSCCDAFTSCDEFGATYCKCCFAYVDGAAPVYSVSLD